MSLNTFFPEQIDELKAFTFSSDEVVRCIRLDTEMESVLNKVLLSLDEDPEFPHALVQCSGNFDNVNAYFDYLLEVLQQEYKKNSARLKAEGGSFNPPDISSNNIQSPFKFIKYASALAESLPNSLGAIVLIIDPDHINDPENYKKSIEFIADEAKSSWIKFLVRDQRVTPVLEELEKDNPHIGLQIFYLSPDEIQKRVQQDLKTPGLLNPAETRRYLGLLAGFSFANKEYDKSIQLQKKWVQDAQDADDPGELANALYNLANTYMADEQYPEATDQYCKACQICSDYKLDSLAPFIYTNLGLNLHRQGEFGQAFSCLKVARDMYQAQKQVPGEAHVVDCLAQIYALDEQNEKAEQTWKYALKIYEGITSEIFQDLRESGIKDISAKLENFYKNTDQEHKIEALS